MMSSSTIMQCLRRSDNQPGDLDQRYRPPRAIGRVKAPVVDSTVLPGFVVQHESSIATGYKGLILKLDCLLDKWIVFIRCKSTRIDNFNLENQVL